MKSHRSNTVAWRSQSGTLRMGLLGLACAGILFLAPIEAKASVPCGPWIRTPTPNVGNSVTRLTSVTVLSPADAWSVGYWRDLPVGSGPLALHWNGSAWNQAILPPTGSLGTLPEVTSVDAAPGGDVWVVGSVTTTYPANNLPLVLRWRNGSWDRVETVTLRPETEYPYGARGGFAYEVDALAPDDVWAVGQAAGFGDAATTTLPMALHWDGSGWTDVDVPRIANRHHQLNDLVAIASDDVWAVGDYRNTTGPFRGVTYHWNGQSWSHVASPIEAIASSGIDDVAATGPNDVWALGGGNGAVLLMHWDGSQWSLAPPPPNSGGSLAAVGPNDLWVSGWNGFWHWDGTGWTEVPASVPGATYVIRSGGMEIVGGCDVWCVGFSTLADGITSSTLAERLQVSGVSAVDAPLAAGAAGGLDFPNPYRPGDEIRWAMPSGGTAGGPASGSASVAVYDLRGAVVRTLSFGAASGAGSRATGWDGRTESGGLLPSGVYFLRVEGTPGSAGRKLLFLR